MIPKIIHTAWFGPKPIPEVFFNCAKTWTTVLPEFTIKLWREGCCVKSDYFKAAYSAGKFGLCSDYFRHDILYREGGVWFDIDIKALKPIDDILNDEAFVGIQRDDTIEHCINPAVCGFVPGSWYCKKMIDAFNGRDGGKDSGPLVCVLTTDLLRKKGLVLGKGTQNIEGAKVYSRDYFFPTTWGDKSAGIDLFTENTRTEHLWEGSWL
jgi:hypothetical protein